MNKVCDVMEKEQSPSQSGVKGSQKGYLGLKMWAWLWQAEKEEKHPSRENSGQKSTDVVKARHTSRIWK